MNINHEKIKELVLAYSELDEEYQNRKKTDVMNQK